MSKNILVLAGGGFLGKALINSFKKNGFDKIGCIDIVNPNIESVDFYNLNILSSSDQELFNIVKNYDIVVNCLGQITNPINLCFRLNSEGMKMVTNAVVRANNFLLHFSTVTVYGSCSDANEESSVNPETAYSCSKAFAEYMIESMVPSDRYCIVRLSNLYGEEQPKGVFSYIKRSYNSDRILDFNNNGEMIRYYLHVNDCADIVTTLLLNRKVGKYNLIGPDKLTLKQLISLAEKISGVKFKTYYNESISPDNTMSIADEKIKREITVEYVNRIQKSFGFFFNKM